MYVLIVPTPLHASAWMSQRSCLDEIIYRTSVRCQAERQRVEIFTTYYFYWFSLQKILEDVVCSIQIEYVIKRGAGRTLRF